MQFVVFGTASGVLKDFPFVISGETYAYLAGATNKVWDERREQE